MNPAISYYEKKGAADAVMECEGYSRIVEPELFHVCKTGRLVPGFQAGWEVGFYTIRLIPFSEPAWTHVVRKDETFFPIRIVNGPSKQA